MAVARSGAARLAKMVLPDGRFRYRYALPDPSITDGAYSNVRHIGAVFGLLDYEREGWDISGFSNAVDRAAAYMNESIFRPYGGTDALCVFDEGVIKLGGSALGVAAELGLFRRSGDVAHRDRAIRLARYVELQSLADGDFVQMRVPGPISTPHPMRTDFVTGQGLLALALIAEETGEAAWQDRALASAEKLARRDHSIGSEAHWMLYALEVLFRSRRAPWLLDYAERLVEAMPAADPWRNDQVSTPIACQTEGLLAYARMLRSTNGKGESAAGILKRVLQNLRRQLRFYHPSGAFVHSLAKPEVRIDYIQHNVTGFLGYAHIAREAG